MVAGNQLIDLRSDTVTKPTSGMYRRMMEAPVGDDGLDGDPTVRDLEEKAAQLLGKEAALFVASCTMANLLAILTTATRNSQVILESESHIYSAERGGAAFTGAFYLPIQGRDGEMDLAELATALEGNSSRLPTALIGMETSHNNAGGTVPSLAHMEAVQKIGISGGAKVHLDGARLFNAAVFLEVEPSRLARHCDSVSLCLSKGLSAPVGALLVGTQGQVDDARKYRRMLGGQQRQAGVVAAAGLEALEIMPARLKADHERANTLAQGLQTLSGVLLVKSPQTNIVQVDVSQSGSTPAEWTERLKDRGLLVRPWNHNRLRCVTHRHITDDDIERSLAAFLAIARG